MVELKGNSHFVEYQDAVEGIKKILVEPVTDHWLVKNSDNLETVNKTIGGRVKDIEAHFIGKVETSPIAKTYGLEKPLDIETAHLLAFTELLDEYHKVKDFYNLKTKEEKDFIRKEIPGKSRSEREELKTKYDLLVSNHSKRGQDAAGVEDLIIRSFIMEYFFFGNSRLVSLPKAIDKAKEKTNKPERIDYFLERISHYFLETYDGSLFSNYFYREARQLVEKGTDCEVLGAMLNFMFNSAKVTFDEQTASQLAKIGESFVEFVKRRASTYSLSKIEKYPRLSIIYDFLCSSFYAGDIDLINKTSKLIDSHFSDFIGTPGLKEEINLLGKEEERLSYAAGQVVSPNLLRFNNTPGDFELPEDIVAYTTSPETRLIVGFSAIGLIKERTDSDINGPRIIAKVNEYRQQAYKKLKLDKKGIDLMMFQLAASKLLGSLSRPKLFSKVGIDIDLSAYVYNLQGYTKKEVALPERRKLYEDLYAKIIEKPSVVDPQVKLQELKKVEIRFGQDPGRFLEEFFSLYFPAFFSEYGKDSERLDKENDFLWRGVLDNSVWFVSPRGDRFTVRKDSQLSEWAIESVTFRIDKRYPREHKAQMKIEGVEHLFEFWLDINRNVLMGERKAWIVDPDHKQIFTNVLLRRLYYITSGILKEERRIPPTPTQVEGAKIIDYIRAHYDVLSSPRFTLTSKKADTHRKEIKAIYGIDLDQETERRKKLNPKEKGYLKPYQLLTFSKERAVGIPPVPNELVFDPEAIRIVYA